MSFVINLCWWILCMIASILSSFHMFCCGVSLRLLSLFKFKAIVASFVAPQLQKLNIIHDLIMFFFRNLLILQNFQKNQLCCNVSLTIPRFQKYFHILLVKILIQISFNTFNYHFFVNSFYRFCCMLASLFP